MSRTGQSFFVSLAIVAFIVAAAGATSEPSGLDWPQWRGPGRDGVVASFTPPARWPDALTLHWKTDVGLGYATPLLVGSHVYVFARQGENEGMTALDAATGNVLWRTSYRAPFTLNSGASRHGPGPKSTPAFADGRLFAIGMTGAVTAFGAADGKILWQVPGTSVVPIFTTYASSPVVDGGLVFFHVGGHDQGALTAFDVATGGVKWRWTGDGPGYGSPIIANLDGTRQIITLTQKKLVGVSASTGELLWERPYATPSVTNAQTPSLLGNLLILGDSGHPLQAFTLLKRAGQWTADVAWENADVPMELSDALLAGETLFGLSTRNRGQYFAVDAKTGRMRWTSPPRQAAHAAIVRAGDLVFSLEDDGELVIIRASDASFEPVQRYKVAETDTWTPPVISGARVFIKDVNTVALWTWDDAGRTPAPQPPRAPASAGPGAADPTIGVSAETALRADILFWESIRNKDDAALFEAYLRQFPNGTFRVLAEARLKEFGARPAAPSTAPDAALNRSRAIPWVSIPAGRFQMGCVPGDKQCQSDEKPRHMVDVAAFRIMTTDVTVGVYRAFADRHDRTMPMQPAWNNRDDHPLVGVSWADAAAFCQAHGWRLPTEAEWEYAARGGVDGALYVWGNTTRPIVNGQAMANVGDDAARRVNSGWADLLAGYDDGHARTSPVGVFPPNGFGLYDMAGNVWRWTSTLERPYPYRANDGREDPDAAGRRILRGGSWITPPRGMRTSYRVKDDPRDEDDNHGFRCVESGTGPS